MTISNFKDLKKNRQQVIDDINKEFEAANQKEDFTDNTYWYPKVDKAGNGFAIVRFLPPAPNNKRAYAPVYSHGFKGPGKQWYIENSRTTKRPAFPNGDKDPVADMNSKLWKTPEGQAIVKGDGSPGSKRSRKLHYHMCVYVIKDPASPENEGKVFKFKAGKKIFDKIEAKQKPKPEFADPGTPVFDLWEGANFRLICKTKDGFRNYDDSEWEAPGPLFKDDAKLEEIWNQTYGLDALLEESNFKSYADLQARLVEVLSSEAVEDEDAPPAEDDTPPFEGGVPIKEKTTTPKTKSKVNYFESLAND